MRLPINHNGHIATCVANAHAHSLRHTLTHTKSHTQANTRAHPHTLLQTLCSHCMTIAAYLAALWGSLCMCLFLPSLPLFSLFFRPISLVLLYHFVSLCVALLSMPANDSVSRVFQFFATFARREKSFASKMLGKVSSSSSLSNCGKIPGKSTASISAVGSWGTGVFFWQI